MTVTSHVRDDIGVIIFSNPPLNTISNTAGIPQGIAAELEKLGANPSIKAIVLASEGKTFSAGADITEFNNDPSEVGPPVRALIEKLDGARVPLVAAIQGSALGGGLEVALGCDYRVVAADARLGLPEATLGVIPGAGGTQRLPRLVGGSAAARLIASGRIIPAQGALNIGLADRLASDDLLSAAVDFAREIAAKHRRRSRDLPLPGDDLEATLAELRASLPEDGRGEAPSAALDAIEHGATYGISAGLEREYALFDGLLSSPVSRALRHAFISERAVGRVPGLNLATEPKEIRSVAVIGAGTMGIGISLAIAQAGLKATVIDLKPEALERAEKQIRSTVQRDVDKGRLDQVKAEELLSRLFFGNELTNAAGHDLIIEAVFEDMGVKKQVFEQLDWIADKGTILASNTSTLDLNQIAAFTSRPHDVVGLHFFSPANIMKLLEVIRGDKTSDATLASAMSFAKKIRKVGVVSGVCDGFIGNRMFEEYLRQAYFLLEEGALPQQVDSAMERWGMAMGPLRTMDLAGQDIGWNIRKRRAVEQPDRPYSRIPDLICERGWFGQKTGRGYYIYGERGAKPAVDPEVEAIVLEESARLGITRREISDQEIVERCLFALVNEGAKLLAEGIAARPLDVDTVWMNGYGFPKFRGGPMFYADLCGLPDVVAKINDFAKGHQGWAWEAAPLLVKLVEEGKPLSSLNEVQ